MALIDDDFLKDIANKLPAGAKNVEDVLTRIMVNASKIAGDISAAEFSRVWSEEMDKKLSREDKVKNKLKENFVSFFNIANDAEKLRTQVTITEERRRYNEFEKNLAEQRKLLEEDTKRRSELIKANATHYKNAEEEITKVTQRNIEARAALDKQAAKEGKLLESQANASEGWRGKLGSLGEASGIMGALKSTFSMLATANVAMIAVQQTLAYPQAQAGLRGAQANIGGGKLSGIFDNMPAGLTGPIERMQMMQSIFTQAPRLITETSESTRKFVGYMGYFGLSMKDSTDILIAANRNLNMSSEDVMDTFKLASSINKKYGLSVTETADLTLKMVNSLKMMGMGSKEAIGIMQAIPEFAKLGGKIPSAEIKGYAEAMSGFIGSMTPSKLGGMMMYLKGGGLPSSDLLEENAKNAPQMLGEMYEKIKGQFGGDASNMRLYIAEGFTQSMGLSGFQGMKASGIIDNMMKNMESLDMENIYSKLKSEGISTSEQIAEDGLKNLVDMNGYLKSIDNILKDTLAPLGMALGGISKGLGAVSDTGGFGRVMASTVAGGAIGSIIPGVGTAWGAGTGFVSGIAQELMK